MPSPPSSRSDPVLEHLHPATAKWFAQVFRAPTAAQQKSWPEISAGRNTLLLAPTGSGKTLAAFLIAIDRIMFDSIGANEPASPPTGPTRVLYVSPLKALGVDVERNLKAPIVGIQQVAEQAGCEYRLPSVGVRSGDTPSTERVRMVRTPPDILITTPESLYLLLTSKARKILTEVEAVIVDEIHSLVGNKRGAHLFVSLERLEKLRRADRPDRPAMQRIGLSATQRPLDEVARLLGGAEASLDPDQQLQPREVVVVEAGRRKPLDLKIEVPVEDMTQLGGPPSHSPSPPSSANSSSATPSSATSVARSTPTIWPAIHPRLVELIRSHRTTMIFVNSRRLAERLAAAINEAAEEEIALAHHGSLARETRLLVEDRLKRGQLPAIVATSSLELGIDMGSVDLVIQIEAPPSIASGLQRVGRAGHQVDGQSKGIVFPKYRGDLLSCSAAAGRMLAGEVEEIFYPRNPLDVLAQQVVAMVSLGPQSVDELYQVLRCSAPFAELSRNSLENVLDLLAGRYPSDEFAELRPRVNWDRITGQVTPRRGTQRLAILNAGTIPDRGLYGVFLADGNAGAAGSARAEPGSADSRAVSSRGGRRVGELDEEMVFETRLGDVFLLGASSWRVVEITHDRVLVVPAPGEPGRMPFWHGDGPGRPLEFGRAIGELSRGLLDQPGDQATDQLIHRHALDERAAANLLRYLNEQQDATEVIPSDCTIVVECFPDEIGDWRVAILSPYGARVHAPWAMAVMSRLSNDASGEVDMMWTDDGILFRLPESDQPPETQLFIPDSQEVEKLVIGQLGSTAQFAARFRENAARALLLPKRQPGRRTPLWLQRRRAADLLSVASRYPSFPIILETYRECLRDVFDIRGLQNLLRGVESREIRVKKVKTAVASPFSSALMFNYIGNFLYDGDAPLAERRAATLALDHVQLRELLGDADLRGLLDLETIEQLAMELQRLDGKYPPRDGDGVHDLLLYLGDMSRDDLRSRCRSVPEAEPWLDELLVQRRVIELTIADESRLVAVEDVGRFRDALGIDPPSGLPSAFLADVADPIGDLVSRFARTHVPFQPSDVSRRLGLEQDEVQAALDRLIERGRVISGEFLPDGRGREFCDVDVLRKLKQRSLAKLRKQIEPVAPEVLGRFLPRWHCMDRRRVGLDGLLDAVQQLQGLALPASDLERRILPARVENYRPSDLDELFTAGEIVWRGADSLGSGDGRIALYLTDHVDQLSRSVEPRPGPAYDRIRHLLAEQGALFFVDIERSTGEFRNDLLETLWALVWNGEVTNDTLAPLRSKLRQSEPKRSGARRSGGGLRSRRPARLPGTEGRWSLVESSAANRPSATERQTALANQLLERYGIVTRELVMSESPVGGFAALYPIFKMMEESGRIRRGYFIGGQGAAQFAFAGAEDRLRLSPADDTTEQVQILAACDPANPYGTALRWPLRDGQEPGRLARTAGAGVVLDEGRLVGYLNRSGSHLTSFLPAEEPDRNSAIQRLAHGLADLADAKKPVFLEKIDGLPANQAELAAALEQHGFVRTSGGLLHRRSP